MIISIDPGSKKSAGIIIGDDFKIAEKIIAENKKILAWIKKARKKYGNKGTGRILVSERVTSYGMIVGASVFDTCVWQGRFIQAWGGQYELLYRNTVKAHICGKVAVGDTEIRRALIERFGSPGNRKVPGFLYKIYRDMWSALAIAICFNDKERGKTAAETKQ